MPLDSFEDDRPIYDDNDFIPADPRNVAGPRLAGVAPTTPSPALSMPLVGDDDQQNKMNSVLDSLSTQLIDIVNYDPYPKRAVDALTGMAQQPSPGLKTIESLGTMQSPNELIPSHVQAEDSFFTRLMRGFEWAAASGSGRLPVSEQVRLAREKQRIDDLNAITNYTDTILKRAHTEDVIANNAFERRYKTENLAATIERDAQNFGISKANAASGIANAIHGIATFREAERKHDIESVGQALELMRNAKTQGLNIKDPEQRRVFGEQYSKIIGRVNKRVGTLFDMWFSNPVAGTWLDMVLAKDPALAQVAESVGYDNLLKNPDMVMKYAAPQGEKEVNAVIGVMNANDVVALDGMSENEFKKKFGEVVAKNVPEPAQRAFLDTFLGSEHGRELMAGYGIVLNKAAVTEQISTGKNVKGRQINALTKQINSLEAKSEKTPAEDRQLQQARQDLRVMVGVEKARTPASGSATLANVIASEVEKTSPGLGIMSMEEAIETGDPKVISAARRGLDKYTEQQAKLRMSQQVKLEEPVDIAKKNVYSVDDLRKGVFSPVREPLTTREFRSGKYVEFDDKEKKEFEDLRYVEGQLGTLENMSNKAIRASQQAGGMSQFFSYKSYQAAKAIGAPMPFLDPTVKTYYDEIAAWSSRVARVLGSEVGVLTDTDIARWTAILPNVTDTIRSAQKKMEISSRMIEYLRKVRIEGFVGNTDPIKRGNKKHDSTLEGYLGSLEAIDKQVKGAGEQEMSAAEKLRKEITK